MLVPWIQENVRVVAQLSIIDLWKNHSQKKYYMYIRKEDDKNILRYVDSSSLCIVIFKNPELSADF